MLKWTIGEAKLTSIPESETPTSPKFMFKGVDKESVKARAEAAPWLKTFVSEEGYLLQKIHCVVIDTGEHRIAVDTCIGNDKQRGNELWRELQGPFLEDMAEAGYPPESITHVICTHLHVDHVGWNTRLVDGKWVPTFENARYLFVNNEFEHWKTAPDLMGDDVFGDSVAPIHDAGLADLVGSDHKVNDQVWFESTPGHTPGHISVVVESAGERAIITGDMTHSPIQIADPELSTNFDTDQDAARATRHEAFARWADGETLIIGTHFGTPSAGRMVADGDTYKLEV